MVLHPNILARQWFWFLKKNRLPLLLVHFFSNASITFRSRSNQSYLPSWQAIRSSGFFFPLRSSWLFRIRVGGTIRLIPKTTSETTGQRVLFFFLVPSVSPASPAKVECGTSPQTENRKVYRKKERQIEKKRNRQLGLDVHGYVDGHAALDVLEHLVVAETLEREAAEGDDLEEQHAVRPDVRHRREQAVDETLGRHPPHRHHTFRNTPPKKIKFKCTAMVHSHSLSFTATIGKVPAFQLDNGANRGRFVSRTVRWVLWRKKKAFPLWTRRCQAALLGTIFWDSRFGVWVWVVEILCCVVVNGALTEILWSDGGGGHTWLIRREKFGLTERRGTEWDSIKSGPVGSFFLFFYFAVAALCWSW